MDNVQGYRGDDIMARSNELWALMKLEEGIFLEWWACKNEERSKIIYAEYLEVVKKRTALAEKEKADAK